MMTCYKKMYHTMFHAVTDAERKLQDAVNILRAAQRDCEDIFIEADTSPSDDGAEPAREG